MIESKADNENKLIVQENFFDDVKEFVLTIFPNNRSEIEAMTWKESLLTYYNWILRLIEPKPRTVFYSQELQKNPLLKKFQKEVNLIQKNIEEGIDLRPYLSTQVDRFPVVKDSTSATPDKDALLNHWGVYHLHLKCGIKENGRRERTDELLFIKVFPDAILLIDILSHKNFSDINLLRVIKKNWPQVLEPYRMSLLEGCVSDDESEELNSGEIINQSRKFGFSPIITVDKSVYAFPVSTSGHSEIALHYTSEFHRYLLATKEHIEKHKYDFQKQIISKTGLACDTFKLKLIFPDSPWISPMKILEENSSLEL